MQVLILLLHRNIEGCSICRSKVKGTEAVKAWSGFSRLVALAEQIEPDDTYLSLIRGNDAIGAKNYWEKPCEDGGMGGTTLKQKLRYMANMGAIDPKNAIKKGAPVPERRDPDLVMDPVYNDWIKDLMDARKTE